jgi:hypothetical protein
MTDELTPAIDVVLDTLSPAALDEHLTYLPGRCSFCGFHPSTQGHAAGCLDGPRGDEETYPVLLVLRLRHLPRLRRTLRPRRLQYPLSSTTLALARPTLREVCRRHRLQGATKAGRRHRQPEEPDGRQHRSAGRGQEARLGQRADQCTVEQTASARGMCRGAVIKCKLSQTTKG